jgi:AcrR family transcriptional regulator
MQPSTLASSPSTLPIKRSRMHSDDRRRQLLRVAIDTFAQRGFGGTKTKDIAAAAGVSEAILFRHFATKEDLYHAILDMKVERHAVDSSHVQNLQFAEQRDDFGLLRALARHIMASFQEDPAFHRLIFYAMLEGHLMANLFHKRFGSAGRGFLKNYFVLRQKEGAFRPCDPDLAVSFAIGTVVHFAMSRHLFKMKRSTGSEESVVNEIATFILGGLTHSVAPRLVKKSQKGVHAQS